MRAAAYLLSMVKSETATVKRLNFVPAIEKKMGLIKLVG